MTNGSISSPWVTNYWPNPQASLRLFCFHCAGGGAHTYRPWARELPRNIEVFGIQQPGRGARIFEKPVSHHGPLVDAVATALLPLLNKPFAFFGHSMGALIAFETARLLYREHSLLPVHLFISACGGPRTRDAQTDYANLPEAELLAHLIRFESAPREVLNDAELMRMMLPTVRADFMVCESYRYRSEPPLPCPITGFGGLQDCETSQTRLEAWSTETSQKFSLQMFSGGHFFLHPHRTSILETISRSLKHAMANPGSGSF
ncbi:MAG TPA: alpha/beta fold hydrolase [Pyrinomonadaceae bacterium]|nr:alpha/beta fold hydrolase [Pyrinomonadaceae bacterium]